MAALVNTLERQYSALRALIAYVRAELSLVCLVRGHISASGLGRVCERYRGAVARARMAPYDAVGLNAASSLSEMFTQMMLRRKKTDGDRETVTGDFSTMESTVMCQRPCSYTVRAAAARDSDGGDGSLADLADLDSVRFDDVVGSVSTTTVGVETLARCWLRAPQRRASTIPGTTAWDARDRIRWALAGSALVNCDAIRIEHQQRDCGVYHAICLPLLAGPTAHAATATERARQVLVRLRAKLAHWGGVPCLSVVSARPSADAAHLPRPPRSTTERWRRALGGVRETLAMRGLRIVPGDDLEREPTHTAALARPTGASPLRSCLVYAAFARFDRLMCDRVLAMRGDVDGGALPIDVIVLTRVTPTASALKTIGRMTRSPVHGGIDVFSLREMSITFAHALQPSYHKLGALEVARVEKAVGTSHANFPQLCASGPIVRRFGYQVGDVVEITRPHPTLACETAYRVVCTSPPRRLLGFDVPDVPAALGASIPISAIE